MTEMIESEKEPTPSLAAGRRPWGLLFLLLLVLIVMGAFGYAYFQLATVNVSLAKTLTTLQKQTTVNAHELTTLQQSMDTLRTAVQKNQDVSAQQEQMLTEWRAAQKGDLSKWRLAEAQYLVRLANDSVQFEYNSVLASILLKRAQQIMQNADDAAVFAIQKSLAADIANVETVQSVNTTTLYLDLTGLNAQIDQLSLPASPLNAKDTSAATMPALANDTSWWRAGLDRSWQALSKIVIVRYNGSNALPLVLPEEKLFLYQNLHAQMESAMWALLHRNSAVYQASLTRAINWIQTYFVQEPKTAAVLQKLEALRTVNIEPPALNFSATLQLFDNYFAQAGQAKAGQ